MTLQVVVLQMLARDDDIPETAQHMRATESMLPGHVWWTAGCADPDYWEMP